MKKILYGVSGIGNGHANREMPIIEKLADFNKIMILTHDDGLRMLSNRFNNHPNVTIVPVGLTFVVGSPTGLDWKATEQAARNQNIESFKTTWRALDRVTSEMGKVDLAITDYEPMTAQYAYSYQTPVVTIDQQSKFLCGELPQTLGGFNYADEVARLHMFFPCVHTRIACSFFKVKQREDGDKVMIMPSPIKQAIVDIKKSRKPSENELSILVYISSARDFVQTPQEILAVLGKEKEINFSVFAPQKEYENYLKNKPENATIYPHGDQNFLKVLETCNGIVSTAGHSLLSEAMFLGIPVYAMPVEPYEQHLNAYMISENGLGISHTSLENNRLSEFLKQIPIFTKNINEDDRVLVRGVGQDLIVDYLTKNFLG